MPVKLEVKTLKQVAKLDVEYRRRGLDAAAASEYRLPTEEELKEEAVWMIRQPALASRAHGQPVRRSRCVTRSWKRRPL